MAMDKQEQEIKRRLANVMECLRAKKAFEQVLVIIIKKALVWRRTKPFHHAPQYTNLHVVIGSYTYA